MELDLDKLRRALARAVESATSPDGVYAGICSVLRHELGEGVLPSIYVAHEDRLWLTAQRGYEQVVHSHSLDSGMYARAFVESRPLAVEHGVTGDPAYVEVVRGMESLAAAPFRGHVSGVVGIESGEPIAEATGLELIEAAARAIETGVARLAAHGALRTSGRLRLLRAVSALATCREPLAIGELLARSVGDALELDLVQVARLEDGVLEPWITWTRSNDRTLQLDPAAFRAQADRFAGELVLGSEQHAETIVGIPLRAGAHAIGYLIGLATAPVPAAYRRVDEALVAATTAAQSLAACAHEHELRRSREHVTQRHHAEAGRERAEQRFHAVVESLSEGLVVLGLDGRILVANASAQRILGRREESLTSCTVDQVWDAVVDRDGTIVPADELPAALTLRDGAPRTGVLLGIFRTDGVECWIEENTRPLCSPEGALEGVVVTFADVTERLEADRRVRAERDFTTRVLDTIADGVLVTEELPDGGRVIVHVNDRISDITGFARDELLGARTPFPWWPVERHAELTSAFASATASATGEYEARFRRRDGDTFPAMVSVGAVHHADAEARSWVITVKDMSQRDALLDELGASRADMERVLESVQEYLYTYELTPDGGSKLVRELSRPVARVAEEHQGGVGPDERWLAATHADDRDGVAEATRRLLAGRPVDYEHRIRDRDGLERWMWVRERPERLGERLLVHGAMTDVTVRKAVEEQLGEALEDARGSYSALSVLHDQIQRIVGSIDELFYTDELRADGSWTSNWTGDSYRRFIGFVPSGVDPQDVWDAAVHPDDRELYQAVDARILALEPVDLEYRLIDDEGTERWVWERMRPSGRHPDGRIVVDGVVQDITGRKRAEERLQEALGVAEQARAEADRASRTDALTGLANRRDFTEQFVSALEATRPGQSLGLLLLDIDHFKRTNDTYGHAAGDAVLREVSRQLAQVVRSGDIVARIGGEELAVVMPGGGRPEDLRIAGERVRTLVAAASVDHEGSEVPFTVSVGAASSLDARTPDSLLAAADRAMYAAKRRGRDRVCLFSELVGDDFLAEVPEALRIAEALALTVSVREGMPPLHNQQVAELAGAIARELQLSPGGVLRCQVSGWLHDIGKTAIPDAILAKPSELTEDEWIQMRRHPEIGEAIVRRIAGLADAASGVRHHHERYDGAGYPDGLTGEEISLEARVVAVADAYSAITSRRPYKRERSREEALDELQQSAGGHLDPAIVDALCRVLRGAARPGSPAAPIPRRVA